MKLRKYILIICCLFIGTACFARQQPIPLEELIKMGKWEAGKITAYLKEKGFIVKVTHHLLERTMIEGEQKAPAANEGDAEIKRTFYYFDGQIRIREGHCFHVEYTTSDPGEYDSMKEYAEKEYILDPDIDDYSDGKIFFMLKDARKERKGGGFLRNYLFRMYTPGAKRL